MFHSIRTPSLDSTWIPSTEEVDSKLHISCWFSSLTSVAILNHKDNYSKNINCNPSQNHITVFPHVSSPSHRSEPIRLLNGLRWPLGLRCPHCWLWSQHNVTCRIEIFQGDDTKWDLVRLSDHHSDHDSQCTALRDYLSPGNSSFKHCAIWNWSNFLYYNWLLLSTVY